MAHAFIEEYAVLPAARVAPRENPNITEALADVHEEGVEYLVDIASFYGLDHKFLMNRFVRSIELRGY